MEITKENYAYAQARIDALLPQITENTASDDPLMLELMEVTDIVESYEKEHCHITTMQRLILFLFLLFAAILSTLAQELTVKSFKLASSDLTAQTQPRKDLNNRNCALIKVGLGLQGVQFEGSIMGNVENKTGEYWVYMPQGNRMLKVKHPNYAPVMVTFADYGVEKVESNRTYVLVLTKPMDSSISSSFLSSDSDVISIPVKNGITIDMVKVEAGTFMMGSAISKKQDAPTEMRHLDVQCEEPVHEETLVNDYYIGKYEVTQALWQIVMGNNPSCFKGDNLPVECISWDDCQEFIRKLNHLTGLKFRLPTQAEWEYAARGGKKSRGYQYSGSNNISDVAWYLKNNGGQTHAVGMKKANELGLFDMSGNILEWCQDWFVIAQSFEYGVATDTHSIPVGRGGSIVSPESFCRPSFFIVNLSDCRDCEFGLRLALSK